MKNIVLFPGSFNPVHCGHLAVAEAALRTTGADALWFVVSPHNPFKEQAALAPEEQRLEMVRLALHTSPLHEQMEACDIEFGLPKPTYTVDTLRRLSLHYPEVRFTLLIGSDNADNFDRWKDFHYILDHYEVLVYPRPGFEPRKTELMRRFTTLEEVPLMPHAATAVREGINACGDLLPEPVHDYIKKHGLYECSE